MAFILKNKNYIRFILTTIIICILALGILFSGNRMPLILYLFGLVLTFFFSDKLKIIIPSPVFNNVLILLPSNLKLMKSETKVRVAEIEFSDSSKEIIPRANLEVIFSD